MNEWYYLQEWRYLKKLREQEINKKKKERENESRE